MFLQSLTGYWQFRQIGQDDWLPATVPGGVHTDLMAAGRIPDPFVGDNELRVAWVAESDWEYRRSVTIDPDVRSQERVLLVCDGLDTLATVILNGTELGQTDNMFRRYRWDVKHLLHDGANELVVRFASPVRYITERQAERPLINVSQGIAGAPYLRKAPCQFGWDWGPQLPPIGIWRDIRLEGRSIAEFADVQLRQHHSADEVALTVDVQAIRWDDTALAATIQVTTPTGATLTRTAVARRRRRTGAHSHRRAAALVAQRLRQPAALPGGGDAARRQTSRARSSIAATSRSGCAPSNCARKRTNLAVPSPSLSMACRSSPKAATGSPPTPSRRG
ncbi:MAG: hypothetical protein V9H26_25505 [Verrucomicrobiota bacterium]